MRVTIAICTLNRAASLRRTLESLAAMRVPDDIEWRVVIVNNGSTDDTEAVIAAFAGRLDVRMEFEPERGLSRARNRAIDAATGDYIVWTDDDVVVAPDWLLAYVDAFRRHPEAAVFGGKIVPRYAPPVPKWVSDAQSFLAAWVFAGRDFGDRELPLSIAEERIPFGPNFAVRLDQQRKYRFNADLGHRPGRSRRGEETDVIERILGSGASGYWVPRAAVEHCADPRQQTRSYIVEYFAVMGETIAVMKGAGGAPLWFGVPRWAWRQLVEGWLRYAVHRAISPSPVWIEYLRRYATAWGTVRYWRSQRGRTGQAT